MPRASSPVARGPDGRLVSLFPDTTSISSSPNLAGRQMVWHDDTSPISRNSGQRHTGSSSVADRLRVLSAEYFGSNPAGKDAAARAGLLLDVASSDSTSGSDWREAEISFQAHQDAKRRRSMVHRGEAGRYPVSKLRWLCLLSFSFAMAVQALVSMSYPSYSGVDWSWAGLSQDKVNSWTGLEPLVFTVVAAGCTIVGPLFSGPKPFVVLASFLLVAGTVVRTLPPLFHVVGAAEVDFICRLCSFASGAGLFSLVSFISCTWFPPRERTVATATSIAAWAAGAVAGLASSHFIKTPDNQSYQFYAEACLSVAALLGAFILGPSLPTAAPSAAMLLQTRQHEANGNCARSCRDASRMLCRPGITSLLAVSGCIGGYLLMMFYSLPRVLQGSAVTLAIVRVSAFVGFGVGAALCAVMYRCTARFARKFRTVIVASVFVNTGLAVLVCLCTPTVDHTTPFHAPTQLLAGLFGLMGLMAGGATPVAFELGAELSFPVSPVLSASFLVLSASLGAFACHELSWLIPARFVFVVMLGLLALGSALAYFRVKATFRRKLEEARLRDEQAEEDHMLFLDDHHRTTYGSFSGQEVSRVLYGSGADVFSASPIMPVRITN